ncbi:MAG: hypothetical protein MZV64_71005 [Ignavibacteriales bacterium]|nr:hypothetical protein [Ignavibacteriales bacterium]
MPGIDEGLAASIVSARSSVSPDRRKTIAWLYEEGLVSADLFKTLAPAASRPAVANTAFMSSPSACPRDAFASWMSSSTRDPANRVLPTCAISRAWDCLSGLKSPPEPPQADLMQLGKPLDLGSR